MLAETASIAAVPVGSATVANKVTDKKTENSHVDSAVSSDSDTSITQNQFGPASVSVSSSNILTAQLFKENFGSRDEKTAEENSESDDPVAEETTENAVENGDLDSAEKKAEEEAQKEQDPAQLSEEELAVVQSLTLQDAKVRNNEEAHVRVGGQYTSQPEYQYEVGPDNRQYAISGHVEIDAQSIAGKPEETIRKLRVVKRAALAPAEPSAEDRKVATVAEKGIQQAVGEIRENIADARRQLRAELKQEAEAAALESTRLEKAAIAQEAKSNELKSGFSQGEGDDKSTNNYTQPIDGVSKSNNIASAGIAAQALEKAASLAITTDTKATQANISNATVISNNDVNFATVTAAPGLFIDAAA